MVPGRLIDGGLVIGVACDVPDNVYFVVRRIGSQTGQEVYEIVNSDGVSFSGATQRPEPPKLDEEIKQEIPKRKSWKQQQRELPKFLR